MVGDVTMQRIEAKQGMKAFEWDAARTCRMCLYGGVWMAPFLHSWYKLLELHTKGRLLLTLVLDQTIAAPMNLFAFFTIVTLAETGDMAQLALRLRERYLPTLLSLWCVWPAVQFVNFKFVPLPKRVLVVNGVGTLWSIYLSYVGNKKQHVRA